MGSPGIVELPADCIEKIEAGPKGKCLIDSSGKVTCKEMLITRKLGCGPNLVVNPKKQEKSK